MSLSQIAENYDLTERQIEDVLLAADTSHEALQQALAARGYDITRTPNEWMPMDADDGAQRSWTLTSCINALQRLMAETHADEWIGQVCWLNQWRA